MPRLRDGAGRNGEVWRGPCREFARGPTTPPVWGPSSTANSQRYINDLGAGVRVRQVGGTSVCYLKTVGFLIFQGPHHLHGAVSSFAINPPQRSKPVEFSRKRWGSEKAGQKTTLKNDTFLLKNEAERGWGALIWHRDPTPKGAGGNQVGTTGFAPCPAPSPTHKNHKNPVTLGPQGFAGISVR